MSTTIGIALLAMLVLMFFGILLCAFLMWRGTRVQESDTGLLDLLEGMGYSLHCIEKRWAVTSAGVLVGRTQDNPRAAILSAVGWLVEGKTNG